MRSKKNKPFFFQIRRFRTECLYLLMKANVFMYFVLAIKFLNLRLCVNSAYFMILCLISTSAAGALPEFWHTNKHNSSEVFLQFIVCGSSCEITRLFFSHTCLTIHYWKAFLVQTKSVLKYFETIYFLYDTVKKSC